MGWKRELRRLESAGRQASREADKQKRAIHREFDRDANQIERIHAALFKKAAALEQKLVRDFLATTGFRYEKGRGFVSDGCEIEAEGVTLTLGFGVASDHVCQNPFSPDGHVGEAWVVQAIDILVSQYALLIALRVENGDAEYRIRPSWFKRSNPQESAAYLVDPINNEYYYPVSSTLSGEVVCGAPKIGIIAFELPRRPTSKLELHLSGVKLSGTRGKREDLVFVYADDELSESLARALQKQSTEEDVREWANNWAKGQISEIEAGRSQALQKASGCLVALVVPLGAIVLGVCAIARTLT